MFKSGPSYAKLKTNLRLSVNRFKLLEKKKTEMALKARKEIADFISAGKDDRARIRVEHIIREDYMVEAYELLEMYCDLLLARFGLIETQKELDPGLEESIASIIYATPRLQSDVGELKTIAEQLSHKYGKEFAQSCRSNSLSNVSEKILHKLSVQAPPKGLVEQYMVEIAHSYNVPFEPNVQYMDNGGQDLLIDLGMDSKKNNGPGGSGGGSGGGMGLPPMSYPAPMQYPPQQPPAMGAAPPPLPRNPPQGNFVAPPQFGPPPYNGAPSQPPANSFEPVYDNPAPTKPSYSPGPNVQAPSAPASGVDDMFPNLPSVPDNTIPGSFGGESAGGEDVDFDDLTRRFEQLKKKR